ncbi:histidine phosphatase family protein [Paeniglutamicibacter antarcticus]|uniref:Histidine phosphatase family protein n=1 Tax=Arthrobacter terrae TaxID=2935737 RepID=A0A931CV69_9MICC|nr:histidine phosphatase family protein [Arthrobacter terrae]MBG0741549.1 histidine phosphatase family protein [Arthrobacter terrae]
MGAVELMLIRHGESVGNVAATAAQAAGAKVIDMALRDADVPLSPTGFQQARALGKWLAALPETERPQSLWCSPYLRAQQTAEGAGATGFPGVRAGAQAGIRTDERLRDRELGILDLLTPAGARSRYPEESRRRQWLGKFYYRPPGGESWADVALRLRSLVADLDRLEDGRRVALFCHDAVILLMRYVCEGLTEGELLDVAARTVVLNGSVTRLVRPSGSGLWQSVSFSEVTHLEAEGTPVTVHAGDTDVQPK